MSDKTEVTITLRGLGGGVDLLSIRFEDFPEAMITPELRAALLKAVGLVTSALLAADKNYTPIAAVS